MELTTHEPPRLVVFSRREADARVHSSWELRATVEPNLDGADATIALFYSGSLFGSVLEHIVKDEIESARGRLRQRVEG